MSHSLFISDLHLAADQPVSMAAFKYFIAQLAPQSDSLYIWVIYSNTGLAMMTLQMLSMPRSSAHYTA